MGSDVVPQTHGFRSVQELATLVQWVMQAEGLGRGVQCFGAFQPRQQALDLLEGLRP